MATARPIVGGNWKMHTDRTSGPALARRVAEGCGAWLDRCDVAVFPPFPYLAAVGQTLAGTGIAVGAQDVHPEPAGAFTGEVSTAMLKDLDVPLVLIGHSERRHVMGETDELVNAKVQAALAAGLHVILCVGETMAEREAGRTEPTVGRQLTSGLTGVTADQLRGVVIAYEPVWAIGTGRTATPADAEVVHRFIRHTLSELHDSSTAATTRIQYGGSVKPDNAAGLIAERDIDGFLVGGASLDADDFRAIVKAAAETGGT